MMNRWLRKSRSFWAWYSLKSLDLSIISNADVTSLKWRCFLRIRLICCLITWVTLCMNVVLSPRARWNWISSLRSWIRAWGMVDRTGLPPCEAEICIASKMKLWDVLGMWGWYLGICSICTKFEADLWVFPAKFAKTRKLN